MRVRAQARGDLLQVADLAARPYHGQIRPNDGICGSAAVPAIGEHRYHQFPQRSRDVTLADLGNTPAGVDRDIAVPARPCTAPGPLGEPRPPAAPTSQRRPRPAVSTTARRIVPSAPTEVTTTSRPPVCPAPGTLNLRNSPPATAHLP